MGSCISSQGAVNAFCLSPRMAAIMPGPRAVRRITPFGVTASATTDSSSDCGFTFASAVIVSVLTAVRRPALSLLKSCAADSGGTCPPAA